MKEKDEMKEIDFQIFRIKYEIEQYIERCKALEVETGEKLDAYLDLLSELIKKRDQLKQK